MPPPHFLLPDDEEDPVFSLENQPLNSIASSQVPRSLLIEQEIPLNFHNRHKQEYFPLFVEEPLKPKPTNVVKGFGRVEVGPLKEKTHYDPVPFRGFPPPSNQAYKLTSDGHDPKFIVNWSRPIVTMPSRRNLSIPSKHLEAKSRVLEVAELTSQRRASLSETQYHINAGKHTESEEKVADSIDWNKSVIDDIAKSTLQGIRRDFPHLLIPLATDLASLNIDSIKLQYCKKCRKSHIPPGSPITLPDRDTCGAFLPDWFPTQNYRNPWETFRSLYNEIIMCEERERAFKYDGRTQASKQAWNKEYHDEHPKWSIIGRRHGWWKCRSGPEATNPERNCELCHRPTSTDIGEECVTAAGPGTVSIVDRKKELTDWIASQMKATGLDDKAMAEEMIRRMPTQQVLSYFPKYEVEASELEGYDTGNDSDPDGEKDWNVVDPRPEAPELKAKMLHDSLMASLDLDDRVGREADAATRSSSVFPSEILIMRAGKGFFAK